MKADGPALPSQARPLPEEKNAADQAGGNLESRKSYAPEADSP